MRAATRRGGSLKISDRYANFKLAHCVEDLESLAHVHEIIGVV